MNARGEDGSKDLGGEELLFTINDIHTLQPQSTAGSYSVFAPNNLQHCLFIDISRSALCMGKKREYHAKCATLIVGAHSQKPITTHPKSMHAAF